jgi:hypothetical protein
MRIDENLNPQINRFFGLGTLRRADEVMDS